MKIQTTLSLTVILFFVLIDLQAQKAVFYLSSDAGVSTFYRTSVELPVNSRGVSSNFKLGWNIGINTDYKISDKFSFSTGLHFLSMGTKEEQIVQEFTTPDGLLVDWVSDKTDITSRYLGIPLFIQYKHKKFSFLAGYQVMHSIGGKYKFNKGNTTPGVPDSTVVIISNETKSAKFSSWDTGFIWGINYDLNSKFSIRLRSYHGLSKITSDLEAEGVFRTNQTLTLGVQYYLRNKI